jgi:ribosomal protein L7Ae-like RNA K-turn-binding protein
MTGKVSKILVLMNSTRSSNVRSIKKLAQEKGIPVMIIMKKEK